MTAIVGIIFLFVACYLYLQRKIFYFKHNLTLLPQLCFDRTMPMRKIFACSLRRRPRAWRLPCRGARRAPPSAQPLVTPAWLNSHRADPGVVVLDIRSAIDGGGAEAFAQGHIPGAVHSDYDKAGWRVTRNDVPFMLPTTAELEKLIGELGIDEDSHVVVVPAGVNVLDFGSAARIYWTLKDRRRRQRLDPRRRPRRLEGGGLSARDRHAHAIAEDLHRQRSTTALLALAPDVEKIEQNGGATLVDARPASFFPGKEKAPASAAYGHIPGAINVDSANFYDPATNRLQAASSELAAIASAIPAGPVVTYCNTGHWAATDWFVLHELLGRSDVRLYAGSMVEWTSRCQPPDCSLAHQVGRSEEEARLRFLTVPPRRFQ